MTLQKIETAEIYRRLDPTRSQDDCAARIACFCQKWGITELALFGSVLRDDFRLEGENPSDIDLLYTKPPEVRYGFKVFDMQVELQQLLNRKVDLVSKRSIQNSQNPLRRRTILDSAQVIYAGGSASHF
ncbi:MAG: nucleotidyltransferase family protein [Elainellaceae cyanobacterium]